MSTFLILVPARYGSSRFPGKPLAKIHGRSMISYLVDNCKNTGFDYAIVTDDDRIEEEVKSLGASVVRVDDDIQTGSERIALAYERYFEEKNYEYIINVQGDEPLLKADTLKSLADFHTKNPFYDITTLVKPRLSSEDEFQNSNVVKCIKTENGKCLYFTRCSAPFNRDKGEHRWFQHIGVYCYKVDSLKKFVTLPMSTLEKTECLEQLRALENNMSIGALESNVNLIGVDTPEDLKKVEGALGV